jgi:hypothetical protein
MEYNTQNRWDYGLCPSSRKSEYLENTTFRKLDMLPFSGERRETPTLLVPLDRANLSHCDATEVSPSSHLKPETSNFRKVVFSSYLEFRTMNRVQNSSDSEFHTAVWQFRCLVTCIHTKG